MNATGDEALILRTQIARSYGLRGNFDKARQLLNEIEVAIQQAGGEARVRFALEMGRTYASATHSPDELTEDNKARARLLYLQALNVARSEQLDALAIDAVHMMAFVDTAPADQLKWAKEALLLVEKSAQPDAKRWEASIRNNLGYALHQLGHYEEALNQFRQAVDLREMRADAEATRVAYWMVAWTLRAMGRLDEALEIQLRLEREYAGTGKPDPYVFDELAILYGEKQDEVKANHYKALKKASEK